MYQRNFATVFMSIVQVTIVQVTSLNETIETKLRIFGGEEASPGEFPFLVSLQFAEAPMRHLCGGSIIHLQWILTAAHCLESDNNAYIVKAGKHNHYVTEPYEQIIRVESTYPHRRYYRTAAYDIALLKLEKELKLNDKVGLIALPVPRSRPKATEKLILAGWGVTRAKMGCDNEPFDIEIPNTLQKIDVFPVDLRSCRKKLKNSGFYYVHEHNLCATGKSACWGDSGGPLIDQDRKLIGVIIHSYPSCSAVDFPDVYVRVSALIGWIKNRVPLEPKNASSYKPYLAHLLIPLLICNLFRVAHCTYSQ